MKTTRGSMDVSILRMVVVALGSVCGICLCGIIGLAAMGVEPPVALASICSICAGALVGILVPSGNGAAVAVKSENPTPVEVKS